MREGYKAGEHSELNLFGVEAGAGLNLANQRAYRVSATINGTWLPGPNYAVLSAMFQLASYSTTKLRFPR